jgi:hypothetical protein
MQVERSARMVGAFTVVAREVTQYHVYTTDGYMDRRQRVKTSSPE